MIAERFQSSGLQREDSALIEAAAAPCTNQHSGGATAPFSPLMFVSSTSAERVCMNPDFQWQTVRQRVQPVKIKMKKINKINTHAAVECWFIYTSCELWRFHLLRSEQWRLITNTFASLLPLSPSPHFSTSELLNIFRDGCLCMLSVNFSPQMHLHAELKKKERQTQKTNKQIFKKLNTV